MGDYPTQNTDKTIIISGSPLFWALGLYFDEGGPEVKISTHDPATAMSGSDFRMLFDNIKEGKYKLPLKSVASASGENIDIEAADGQITRFPKYTRIVDGKDDTQVLTDPEKDENATGKGGITVTTNQGDMDNTSWTAFLNYLVSNKNGVWLLAIPLGFNYNKRYVLDPASAKADGFYFLTGKIGNDIEGQIANANSTIEIEFIAYKFTSASSLFSSTMVKTALTNLQLTGLRLKGTSPVVTITPPQLTSAHADKLYQGDLALVPSS